MELAEKMHERSEKLNKLHELKKGKRGQHLKDIKDQINAIEQKVLERQSQFSVLNADINGSINRAAQERRYLMTSGVS